MKLLLSLAALFTLTCGAFAGSLAEIPFKDMDGKELALKNYSGKVVLVVNVASKCGHTKQYAPLEVLYKKYADQGLVILGFPCNDFASQEPGTNAEIQQFCTSRFAVTFPILDKIHVKGPEQHPLYAALTGPGAKFPGDVKWNFGKFLIGKDGTVLARFEPGVLPDSAPVVAAIEAALQ